MRAAIRTVLLAAIIAGATSVPSAQATASHTTVCVVSGTATGGTPVNYFALGGPSTEWMISLGTSTCVSPFGLTGFSASFTLAGWCELATSVEPSDTDIRAVDGVLVFTGAVNGTLHMTGTDPCVYRSPVVFFSGTLVIN
ncbi:MAG: hypothetical protein KY443_06515 [Actinobacteria bacterium]|nr:hypothetical protein [Actinomycetota bacterium]